MISLPSITCVQNRQFKGLNENTNEMDLYSFTEKIQSNTEGRLLCFLSPMHLSVHAGLVVKQNLSMLVLRLLGSRNSKVIPHPNEKRKIIREDMSS